MSSALVLPLSLIHFGKEFYSLCLDCILSWKRENHLGELVLSQVHFAAQTNCLFAAEILDCFVFFNCQGATDCKERLEHIVTPTNKIQILWCYFLFWSFRRWEVFH